MRVILYDDIFEAPHSALLGAIFLMGAQGRHQVQLHPQWAPTQDIFAKRELQSCDAPGERFRAWFETMPQDAQRTIYQALGQRLSQVERRRWTLRVTRVTHGAAPREGARRQPDDELFEFLVSPLTIYMENGINDALMLRRWADHEALEQLEAAEARGWLRFAHGNGITGMPAIARQAHGDARWRMWFICDRDAVHPERSRACVRIVEACAHGQPPIPYHVWRRRMIENYLPVELLVQLHACPHVNVGGLSKADYQSRLEQLSEDELHTQNLKDALHPHVGGLFAWDAKRILAQWSRWRSHDHEARQEVEDLLAAIFQRM